MGFENFTTYTEVDPNSRISKTAARVTWASLTRAEDAYAYSDKGAAYFDGDFTHYLTLYITSITLGTYVEIWALMSVVGSVQDVVDVSGDGLKIEARSSDGSVLNLYASEINGGTEYWSSALVLATSTLYYLKITRDETVGTYGTLYLQVYSDADRTTLLSTATLALHEKVDLQYIYGVQSHGTSGAYPVSGYIQSLELTTVAGSYPTVTTQAMTSIAATTATGNGNMVSLGVPNATQHGHCWSTTITPTTDDSKTENGAPGATGAFTSSLTSLAEDTKYYVRAYATNAHGTSYGSQVVFTSGATGSGTVFPVDDVARASSIRHIFRPGFFRMQVGLGDLGFDVDVAEGTVRSELDTAKDVKKEVEEAEEVRKAETERARDVREVSTEEEIDRLRRTAEDLDRRREEEQRKRDYDLEQEILKFKKLRPPVEPIPPAPTTEEIEEEKRKFRRRAEEPIPPPPKPREPTPEEEFWRFL